VKAKEIKDASYKLLKHVCENMELENHKGKYLYDAKKLKENLALSEEELSNAMYYVATSDIVGPINIIKDNKLDVSDIKVYQLVEWILDYENNKR
jgi:hypothetical protein